MYFSFHPGAVSFSLLHEGLSCCNTGSSPVQLHLLLASLALCSANHLAKDSSSNSKNDETGKCVNRSMETFEMGQAQSWSDVEMGLKAANDKMASLSLCAEP